MLVRIRIAHLPLVMLLLAVVSAATAGGISVHMATRSAIAAAAESLSVIQSTRQITLSDYLKSIGQDLSILSTSSATLSALDEFAQAWDLLGGAPDESRLDRTRILKSAYIRNNKNPVGMKYILDDAGDGSVYSGVHKKYHPWFRRFLLEKGYYDVFLIAQDGSLVYSVFKEEDFATNLVTGPWKDTDLGRVFRDVKANPKPGFQSFADFKHYIPSNGAPASFIGAPILGPEGEFRGALVFQMPIGRINEIMRGTVGMGRTGETYIVGGDYLMRSDSRFDKDGTTLKARVVTSSVKGALTQRKGVSTIKNHYGVEVLSAYGPLDFMGVRWGILAEISYAEVMQPINKMRLYSLAGTAISLLLIGIVAFLAARSISRSVEESSRPDERA